MCRVRWWRAPGALLAEFAIVRVEIILDNRVASKIREDPSRF